MSKKILILDAEDAPYPLSVARSLGSSGHEVYLGFSYGSHIFSAYSKYCKGYLFYPDPSYATEDFARFFKQLAGKYDFIIPTMEKSQLSISSIKEYLEKAGTSVPIPDRETLNVATNKASMLEIARKNEVLMPPTLISKEEPDIVDVVKKIGIPFIMKVATEINVPPGPRNRYFVVKNKISQHEFSVLFRKLLKYGPVVLQQYIKGIGIGASFIFSRNSELIGLFGHKRILERFPEGGPSVIAETFFHPEAIKYGNKLLRALKWQGVAMTEFKLGCDGKLYFMELNPRFWGTLPLAIASGVDFPNLLINYYDDSHKNANVWRPIRRRVFLKFLTIPYLLVGSMKEKSRKFCTKILFSLPYALKRGVPFIEELEKFDLLPLIKVTVYNVRKRISRNKISKLNNLLFGPKLKYKKIEKYGVRVVVDLREKSEKEGFERPSDGIEYYEFPVKDDSAPDIPYFLALISKVNELTTKGSVYIHCRIGQGRAPTIVIGYLLSKGFSLNDAYSIVYENRPSTNLTSTQKKVLYELSKYLRIRQKSLNLHESI